MAQAVSWVGALVVLALCACGGKSAHDAGSGAPSAVGGNTAGSGGSFTGDSGSAGAPGKLPDGFGCPGTPTNSRGITETTACSGYTTECEALNVPIYFLVERSARMAEPWGATTRWQVVLDAFTQSPLPLSGGLAFSAAPNADSCSAASYAVPALFWGSGAPISALKDVLQSATPAGDNPLLVAYQGLVAFAQANMMAYSGSPVIAIVTATPPGACAGESVAALADAIQGAEKASPAVHTSLIALDANYDITPLASGSFPFPIGPTNAVVDLSAALQRLLDSCAGLPGSRCSYPLPQPPAGQVLDPNRVTVRLAGTNGIEYFSYVASEQDCAGDGGFYFDTLGNVVLCPCACARSWEMIEVLLGCARGEGGPR